MFKRIRQRLDGNTEQGFTLIELLVVIIIIGILLAIAVPSYLGFRSRAAESSAKANVRAALPAVEAYYADFGTYATMNLAALRLIDPNVKLDGEPVVTATTYCIDSAVSGATWKISGPGVTAPASGAC
ncbi:MAG: prepilin-type N-terminal cleavage/methylation domain-containing protein [Actinobacteria bacterium]|nr:prepilin-type N-terminal cleavage/methylation domain-containing protein [Actinomycetota bacterium]